ncbi:hypothetical protein MMC21_003819 [Puttea exsequens]|nr:hypothetical protein [Puttea exsequens]
MSNNTLQPPKPLAPVRESSRSLSIPRPETSKLSPAFLTNHRSSTQRNWVALNDLLFCYARARVSSKTHVLGCPNDSRPASNEFVRPPSALPAVRCGCMARGKLTEAYGVLGDAIAGIGIGEEAWVEKYKAEYGFQGSDKELKTLLAAAQKEVLEELTDQLDADGKYIVSTDDQMGTTSMQTEDAANEYVQ